MFIVTLTSPIVDAAGTPVTFTVDIPAAPVASGIGTLIVPEAAVTVVVDDDELVKRTDGSPTHIVTDAGVTVGGGGV
jgi:hypothetical protein